MKTIKSMVEEALLESVTQVNETIDCVVEAFL